MSLRHLLHLLRILCAAGLLWWVMHRLRLEEIVAFPWSSVDLRWLLLAFALGGLSLLGWAGRWWWFLRVYDVRAGFGDLLRLTLFADFFNLYFLGPLGADGVRLLGLTRHFPERRGTIVGSLLLDHLGGLFGGVALYWVFSRSGALPSGIVAVADKAVVMVATVCFLGLGVILEPVLQRMIARLPGLRRISAWMSPMFAGAFRQPWAASGFVVSVLSTACAFAAFWAAARSIGVPVSLPRMLGLMPAVDLVASLPVSVSGLGVRENLIVEWLGSQPDCGRVRALAASLLGFAAIGIWGLIGGLWMLVWNSGIRPHPKSIM
jgi:uncharacterized membrane protein YbhN (UPF0104 family)